MASCRRSSTARGRARGSKATATDTRAHWLARLDVEGVPAGPIKALGIPVKLSETPGSVDRPAPLVGEHTAVVSAALKGTGEQRRSG